jgi:hypothetical protein
MSPYETNLIHWLLIGTALVAALALLGAAL